MEPGQESFHGQANIDDESTISSSPCPSPLSIPSLDQHHLLLPLHPNTETIPRYWTYFKDNCNLIRILHLPTTESMILYATEQLDCISNGQQMLMFAIYFAVVISLSDEECLHVLGGDRDHFIRLYRYAMDQCIALAQVQDTKDPIVIQALIVYLISLKGYCSSGLLWTLTSITVRLSHKMGLHRDGDSYSPFDTEIRRRLWWGVFWLDSRAREDAGYQSTVEEPANVDVQLPCNANDCDIYPSMSELPECSSEWTDMTFTRVIFQAVAVLRRLTAESSEHITRCEMTKITQDVSWRHECVFAYQDKLNQSLSTSASPDLFSDYASIATWIMLNKLWLVAYYPYLFNETSLQLPQDMRRSLLVISINVIEMVGELHQRKKFQKWTWLTKTFTQSYALAYILFELGQNSGGDLTERAWNTINAALQQSAARARGGDTELDRESIEFGHVTSAKSSCCTEHELLNKLLRRARSEREKQADLGY